MAVIQNVPKRVETAQRTAPAAQVARTDRPLITPIDLSKPTPEKLEIRRRSRLTRWSQILTFLFVMLELGIVLRVVLKLIEANPASPLALFVYQVTEPFLAPFAGLTPLLAVGRTQLEIPAMMALAAYGVLYLLIIRAAGVVFNPVKARGAAKDNPDL